MIQRNMQRKCLIYIFSTCTKQKKAFTLFMEMSVQNWIKNFLKELNYAD